MELAPAQHFAHLVPEQLGLTRVLHGAIAGVAHSIGAPHVTMIGRSSGTHTVLGILESFRRAEMCPFPELDDVPHRRSMPSCTDRQPRPTC